MAKFTKGAQDVIDRLQAINYDEPYWNLPEIVKAFERQYKALGIDMPKVEVADDMLIGYKLATDAAWGAAWGAARGAAWGAARGAARGAAWGAAWGAARGAAWGAAWDAARGAARGAARDAAWGAAWGAAALNTGLKDKATLKWIEISQEELKAMENGLGFFFPMKDKLVLVPIPRMIMQGDRLHYDHGKAVSWSNDTGFYFLQGVRFDDEELYYNIVNQTLTAEQTLTIPNADQRAAAMSMLRPDRLLKQMNARLIHTGIKGTMLYEVKDFMGTGRTEFCMWMKDASTPREFIEWVEPKIAKQGDADLCQANAFGIPLEDYLSVELEG